VALSPRLVAALRAHIATFRYAEYNGHRSEWLPHHVIGDHAGDGIAVNRRKRVKRAAISVGITKAWQLHDLRHRLCTVLIRNGVPLPIVMKQMRHANIQMTMKYVHPVNADLMRGFAWGTCRLWRSVYPMGTSNADQQREADHRHAGADRRQAGRGLPSITPAEIVAPVAVQRML